MGRDMTDNELMQIFRENAILTSQNKSLKNIDKLKKYMDDHKSETKKMIKEHMVSDIELQRIKNKKSKPLELHEAIYDIKVLLIDMLKREYDDTI